MVFANDIICQHTGGDRVGWGYTAGLGLDAADLQDIWAHASGPVTRSQTLLSRHRCPTTEKPQCLASCQQSEGENRAGCLSQGWKVIWSEGRARAQAEKGRVLPARTPLPSPPSLHLFQGRLKSIFARKPTLNHKAWAWECLGCGRFSESV